MTITNERETYNGKGTKQIKGTINQFNEFFRNEKFNRMIEIGSGNGVLSTYFARVAFNQLCQFSTYDIKDIKSDETKKELNTINANVYIKDINDIEIEKELCEDARYLIINDGALKVPQLIRFGKIIKPNDIILIHDYYKDQTESANGIIVPNDFKTFIKKEKLKVIYENLFDDYLWLCITK